MFENQVKQYDPRNPRKVQVIPRPHPTSGANLRYDEPRVVATHIRDGRVVRPDVVAPGTPPSNVTVHYDSYPKHIGATLEANIKGKGSWDGVTADGLVQEIADYVSETSIMPQPTLSIAAAVSTISAIAGRQYMTPTGTSLSAINLMLGPTGVGKNNPIKAPARLLDAAGLGRLVGAGLFMSRTALYEELQDKPRMLAAIDEAGNFFEKMCDPRAGNHEKGIGALLRDTMTTNFDRLTKPRWAGMKAKDIHAPNLVLHMASTEEQLFRALRSGSVEDGTLNRISCWTSHGYVEANPNRRDEQDIPPSIITRMQEIDGRGHHPNEIPFVDNCEVSPLDASGLKRMTFEPEARLFFDHAQSWQTNELIRDPEAAPLVQRTAEKALRLASVLAIGCGRLEVTVEDLIWGMKVAQAGLAVLLDGVRSELANTEFEADCKKVLKSVRKNEQRSRAQIQRSFTFKGEYLDSIIRTLTEAEEIKAQLVVEADRQTMVWVPLKPA